MKQLILFAITYILVFIIYLLWTMRKAKEKNKKKKPMEVNYLVFKYHLDLKKINYKKLLFLISVVSSLDISLVVSIVMLFKSNLLRIFGTIILVIIFMLISYHLIGCYYKKKGMIKND